MTGGMVVPRAIRRRDTGIEIDWDGAGHVTFLRGSGPSRLACPCAGCVDEMSGRPVLDPTSVPADVRPQTLELVGAYGLKVHWSDGHSTGIYTFEALLRGCP